MAFENDPEFKDDFRKVGPDATSSLEPSGSPSNPTENASSENIEVAGADEPADDLEDDEESTADDGDGGLDDLEDDDLADEDDLEDDEDEDDFEDEDDLEDDDEDAEPAVDPDADDLEEDDSAVAARLADAEKRARAS